MLPAPVPGDRAAPLQPTADVPLCTTSHRLAIVDADQIVEWILL
ncbi:hypothetical protein [Mycobacterium cookii]